jgi:predicted PolB exonuclease-like 3'-5' exonuclease
MLVNNLKLPKLLKLQGLKSWEVKHIDTMQLWKFGDVKSFVSLDLLATILGIQSPKAELDGSKIYEAYYHQNDLPSIVKYCQNDVLALAQIYLKLSGNTMLNDNEVFFVE